MLLRAFVAVFGLIAVCRAGELAEAPEHSAPSVPAGAPSAAAPVLNLDVVPLTDPDQTLNVQSLVSQGQPSLSAQAARADAAAAGLAESAKAAFARGGIAASSLELPAALSIQAAVAVPAAESAAANVAAAPRPQDSFRALPFAAETARRLGWTREPGTLAAASVAPAAIAAAALSPAAAQGAYAAGNGFAFAFTPPQVYRTFRDGHARAYPADRAVLAAASSALIALVSAPLLGKTLWGVQNLFTALMFVAPALLGPLLERRRGRGFDRKASLGLTAASTGAALVLSAALYALTAAFLPPLLGVFLGTVVPSAVQMVCVVTGVVYAGLFIPDTIATIRGRTPKGFTSLVALLYFLDSALFLAWSTSSLLGPGPERPIYVWLAAFNVIGTVGAFLSWRVTRRRERVRERAKA